MMGDPTVCCFCRSSSFVYEERLWDRICTECGSVTAYELPDTSHSIYGKVVTYSRKTYFNVVMDRAVLGGTVIPHADHEWLDAKFVLLVKRFNEVKTELGMKSYPSYVYTFTCLCELRGIGVAGLKAPKLKQTIDRAKRAWDAIKNVIDDWQPSILQ